MKKIIYLNFLKETSVFFLVSSIAVTIIVWVIQAVNYLEFVTEDGHSFQIYFYYTLLSLPKIYNKLLPFMFFFSIFFTLIKYEEQNQTLIFWTNGISKINFLKVILIFSIFFLILNFVFSLFIVPNSQDKARSYIRKSNIDYLPFLIKPKKFIDTVEKLTIYSDRRDNDILENIIIKDKFSWSTFPIVVACDHQKNELIEFYIKDIYERIEKIGKSVTDHATILKDVLKSALVIYQKNPILVSQANLKMI